MFTYIATPEVKDGVLDLSIMFNACFVKSGSWVREKSGSQDSLLLHEQYHFNICESFARQLRTQLMTKQFAPMKAEFQIKAIFDEIWNEYVKTQDDYDVETQHGLITDKQIAWMKKVDLWLQD